MGDGPSAKAQRRGEAAPRPGAAGRSQSPEAGIPVRRKGAERRAGKTSAPPSLPPRLRVKSPFGPKVSFFMRAGIRA
jgi:hypothetical protein